LRRAARKALPAQVVSARKRGFGVPLDDWFRGPLKSPALETFENSGCVAAKILRQRYWETLWNEHQNGQAQNGERLYALLALEHWQRIFISGGAPPSA
jgi:asparagine synthase (glutamine-hydrolysing)